MQSRLVTKAEYARSKGWNKSTVTRFIAQGKIVLDGDLVDVERSDRMLKLSRAPRGDGVRARHARERGEPDGSQRMDPNDTSYAQLQRARAESEAHKAALLRMEREEKEGRLADTTTVREMAYRSARAARNALFNLRHRLDPELAGEMDPVKRAQLWDREIRGICEAIAKACDVDDGGD